MTYEWTKLETNILNDNRTRMLFEQLGLNGIGAYVLLRSIIGTKGMNGVSREWIDRAIEPFGFRKTFKDVLTHFNLFGYNDDLLVVALPLTDDSSQEPSCTTQRSASCETRGCTTPESSLRDNSLEEEKEKKEEIKKIRVSKIPGHTRIESDFVPPTIEEVKAYIIEKGYNVDPEYFWNYYESTDWHMGNKSKIKRWKSVVVTWHHENEKKRKHELAKEREKDIHDSSYIEPYDGYLPPNAPPRPTPTAVWSISHDAWVEPYGPNRMKPIVGLKDIQKQ